MSYCIHNEELVTWAREERDWIETLGEPKYHAVLSDPPYGISFMGKKWDDVGGPESFQAQAADWGRALMPLLHPGALVLMFGGTRMWHRLAAGMEDAGFHIWDTLMWLHGQGFPKGQDISKLIDKMKGTPREVIGKGMAGLGKSATGGAAFEGGFRSQYNVTAPGSEESAPWTGHKTPQLKPAWEPVLCFRTPTGGKKFAELALEFGSGALNVDAGRIGGRFPANVALECTCDVTEIVAGTEPCKSETDGDEPNFKNKVYGKGMGGVKWTGKRTVEVIRHTDPSCPAFQLDKQADASRFFYCAKASRGEREAGLDDFQTSEGQKYGSIRANRGSGYPESTPIRNNHPTVKPVELNRWLATLLLPPTSVDSRLLVPFSGAGSEMIGAVLAGWKHVVGIELNEEYVRIAEARLAHWSKDRYGKEAELHGERDVHEFVGELGDSGNLARGCA